MIEKLWEHAGMTCALRKGAFNAPCGYVLVPEGHPLHGGEYGKAEACLDVHGGVTFAGDLEGMGWAVGFDMHLTHTKPELPDSWERIEADVMMDATDYCDARGIKPEYPNHRGKAKCEDLVRRCKALAERGQ